MPGIAKSSTAVVRNALTDVSILMHVRLRPAGLFVSGLFQKCKILAL